MKNVTSRASRTVCSVALFALAATLAQNATPQTAAALSVKQIRKLSMGVFETVFLGVVAGVITSVLLYWFSLILIKIIIPWYQRTTYKGIDVSGEWVGKVTGAENIYWNVTLNITQNAHALVGTFTTVKYKNNTEDRITSMNVSGEVWEGFVSLKCRTVSSKNLSFGAMLLKINDSELKGNQIFRNLSKIGPEIVNMEISLKPSEKSA